MTLATGADRAVIEAALAAVRDCVPATLALVVDTSGSTYVRRGAIALFAADSLQVGWLSGGCLEAEIARRADHAAANACIEWMEIDTRDDEDLFAGSAVGCRGRLRLVLLPLLAMPGWQALADAWISAAGPMEFSVAGSGAVSCRIADREANWALRSTFAGWREDESGIASWIVELPAPPTVLIFGAGPETALLFPLLRAIGWRTSVVESRPRWATNAGLADHSLTARPEPALAMIQAHSFNAALVMQHNFELDREALEALTPESIPFIGLLGPTRRRDDLFKLLSATSREALESRLRAPVGLDLGGHGPEAIALSIAAQLQAFMHRH
ncbi:MAG: XdhC family protein [Xanthomonadales bacterium]|nr:XdhC family protein [Xanthomonadales bacterium]